METLVIAKNPSDMERYETKRFGVYGDDQKQNDTAGEIDAWLRSFIQKEPKSYYSYEVIGYVSAGNAVIITVKIWESPFNQP